MAERNLSSWFEKRRESITLKLTQNQIIKVIDAVTELEKSIIAFSEKKTQEAEKNIDRLFVIEVEIDELRRSVFIELTKGSLPVKYREDLKALVSRLDRLADHIKDAARNIKILLEAKIIIPDEFLNIFIKMIKTLKECIIFLSSSIEMLGTNTSKAIEFSNKIDTSEGIIDNLHFIIKISFIRNKKEVDPPTFLILKDLADSIEYAADICADTADFIRVLAAGELAS